MTVIARGADITIPAGRTGRYDLARAVSIDGVDFHSGDLVEIDDEGICRIPATAAAEVLEEIGLLRELAG